MVVRRVWGDSPRGPKSRDETARTLVLPTISTTCRRFQDLPGESYNPGKLFLDITDRVFTAFLDNEAGLLGLAFDTDFETTGEFYVNYFSGTGSFPCSAVRRLVEPTGFFRSEEGDIAEELVLEAERVGESDDGYRFLFAKRSGELLGYACFGRARGTATSWALY